MGYLKIKMEKTNNIFQGFKLEIFEAPMFQVPNGDEKKIVSLAKQAGIPMKQFYEKDKVDEIFKRMKIRIAFLEKRLQRGVKRKEIKKLKSLGEGRKLSKKTGSEVTHGN